MNVLTPSAHSGSKVSGLRASSRSKHPRKRQMVKKDQLQGSHVYACSNACSFSTASISVLHSTSPSLTKGVGSSSSTPYNGEHGLLCSSRFPSGKNPIAIAGWVAQSVVNIKQPPGTMFADSSKVNNRSSLLCFPVTPEAKINNGSKSHKGDGISHKNPGVYMERLDTSNVLHSGASQVNTRSKSRKTKGSTEILSDIPYLDSPIELELTRIRSKLTESPLYGVGIADNFFDTKVKDFQTGKRVVDAGKFLGNVLSPIFKPTSDINNWQAKADSLIKELDKHVADYSPFTMAFAILAENKEVLNATKVIVEHIDSNESMFNVEYKGINGIGEDQAGKSPSIYSTQCHNEHQSSIVRPEAYINPPSDHSSNILSQPSSTCTSSTSSSQISNHPKSIFHSSSSLNPSSYSFAQSSPRPISKSITTSIENHHLDRPLSTTADMTRTSGRIRKPTLRAQEADLSVLGKGKGKKGPKAAPAKRDNSPAKRNNSPARRVNSPAKRDNSPATKDDSGAGTTPAIPEIVVSDEKGNKVKPSSPCRLSEEDERAVNQLLELARAAVAPDFEPEVEVDLAELRRKFYEEMKKESPPGDSVEQGRLADPSELEHPEWVRPHTDEAGWVHTGRVNKHGEEYVKVPPTFAWWRPESIPNMSHLRQPPPRMRSCREIENDKIYGFPPPVGQRNLPQTG